jgi:hypothetical protein
MSRGISEKTRQLVDRARGQWEAVYKPKDIIPTVRHLFYQLAVEEFVPKSDAGYNRVQSALARARMRGDYPWDGIYDSLRQVQTPSTWGGLADYFDTVGAAYRLNKWQGQPEAVEVWIEKDTVRSTVGTVTSEYQVPLLVDRGYLSLSAKFEASQRIAKKMQVAAGGVTVIYIGDFDPSGINMLEEAVAWIRARGVEFSVERLAINERDQADSNIVRFLPVNRRDARASEFIRRYGDKVIEVEALAPEQLQARLRNAIESHIDWALWNAAGRREESEQAELGRLVSSIAEQPGGAP